MAAVISTETAALKKFVFEQKHLGQGDYLSHTFRPRISLLSKSSTTSYSPGFIVTCTLGALAAAVPAASPGLYAGKNVSTFHIRSERMVYA